MVHDSVHATHVNINSRLQVIAVTAHLTTPITLCSIYIPPSFNFTRGDMEAVIAQLPRPFILAGDFNAHHVDWGSTTSDRRGDVVADFVQNANISLLNSDQLTHFTSYTGTLSAIDLVMCTPILSLDFEFITLDDLHGSDHFPLEIRFANNRPVFRPEQRWKLHQADWGKYQDLSESALQKVDFTRFRDSSELLAEVCQCLLDAAFVAIPLTAGKQCHQSVPWWNEECANAIKARKKAYRQFNTYPTSENLIAFKRLKAKARYIIKQSKKNSWRDYVSTITHRTNSSTVWKKIKSICGRPMSSIPAILNNGVLVTSPHDVVSVIASHFASVSSNARYDAAFLQRK